MRRVRSAGGWQAIRMSLHYARRSGGLLRMIRALLAKNACKTCALGMGGQRGGMVAEHDHRPGFPAVCKKSFQAMAADMQGAIRSGFFNDVSIEQMRRMSPRQLEACGRLTQPLRAGPHDTHYHPVDWDRAFAEIATALRSTTPDESFFYFSGRSSNEAGFLLQLFARLYGTNNVNNCSYYCHQASGVGLSSVTGSGTATVTLDDLAGCDLIFLIGGNPASNHPRLMTELMHLKRRGGTVIVINPAKELGLLRFKVPSDLRSMLFGTNIADMYVQPHIGGDAGLLLGISKAIIERGAADMRFVHAHTVGGDAFVESLDRLEWEAIVESSGVERAAIDRVADMYAQSRNTIFCWAMGVTHHRWGVQNVQAIANLALLRGMLGRPGAGLLPLRGHSNVQGIGSVGVTPKLKDAIFGNLETHLNVKLPTAPGRDTMACMEDADKGNMKFGMCLGGNLFGSNPDALFAERALSKVDHTTYLSTTLNTGHARGRGGTTWILPVLARDEESQPTTQESMFNFVRLSDGGPRRYDGPPSEVDVIARIASDYFGDDSPVDWSHFTQHRNIRRAIGAAIPGYQEIADIDDRGVDGEFQISGRTFHAPRFATPDGKARFHIIDVPHFPLEKGELRLTTVRSEGQFNTVVYEEEDLYRHQERRDVILLNRTDMVERGIEENQLVIVTSSTGRLDSIIARSFDIRAGSAMMYYPEANVLVPKSLDAQSRTPAFKSVAIRVTPISADAGRLVQVQTSTRRQTVSSAVANH